MQGSLESFSLNEDGVVCVPFEGKSLHAKFREASLRFNQFSSGHPYKYGVFADAVMGH